MENVTTDGDNSQSERSIDLHPENTPFTVYSCVNYSHNSSFKKGKDIDLMTVYD